MTSAQTLEVDGYQVLEFLGSGARSTIWRVRDRRTDEVCALKRVVRRGPGDTRYLDQATNEYNVASSLSHPVIRRMIEIRRVKRWMTLREILLIMEFCEGRTVQQQRPGSVPEALRTFGEVASALAYMNDRGFVHADMKPNNIIVAPVGTVKIIDLGQSCPTGTVKQRIQGTPDFIAPEQVQLRPLDARTDVFNFGAALYWTLTGRAIPTVLPPKGSVTLKTDINVTPPEQFNPEIPPGLSKLIAECIETLPARRPASMHEVGSRLSLIGHTLAREDRPLSPPTDPRDV